MRTVSLWFTLLTLSAISAATTMGVSPQDTALTTLADQREQTRPLLIFAEHANNPQMGIQLRTLNEHAVEASDRQMVAIAIPFHEPGSTRLQLSATEAEAARQKFHVAGSDFVVILLGKDGGEELRSSKPLSMSKLEETIDAMPMRKEEMRLGK